jgi:transposase
MTYSEELKLTAVKLSFNLRKRYHLSIEEIAKLLDIGRSTLYLWRKMYLFDHKCFGEKKFHVKKNNSYYRKINDTIISYICDTVIISGVVNIKALKYHLQKTFNVTICKSYVYKILKKNKITYKKCQKYKCRYSNDIMDKKREELLKEIDKVGMSNLISLDETSIEIGDKPNYGWSHQGTIIKKKIPHIRQRYSLIMAISYDKVIDYKLVKGSFNGEIFKNFIEGKCLNKKALFMDNARIHHYKKFKNEISKRKCSLIYNVPYCPKYNPIEYVFNVIKSELRKRDIQSLNDLNRELKKIIRKLNKKSFSTYYNHSYDELNKVYC